MLMSVLLLTCGVAISCLLTFVTYVHDLASPSLPQLAHISIPKWRTLCLDDVVFLSDDVTVLHNILLETALIMLLSTFVFSSAMAMLILSTDTSSVLILIRSLHGGGGGGY